MLEPYRKLTQAELFDEARRLFGDNPRGWKFRCPRCRDVACAQDFIDAGADPSHIGQECIGRPTGALVKPEPTNTRGCNWAAAGLLHGPWEVVVPADGDRPERSVWSFALADPARDGAGAAASEVPVDPAAVPEVHDDDEQLG